ncbi:MAG: tetratricopeptide repeat protein [Candidatus Saccharibacteria bacterium]
MKTLLSLFFFLAMAAAASSQQKSYSDLPVTTDSPLALQLYNQGVNDLVSVKISEARDNFTKAVELDPEFMMANAMIAIENLFTNNPDQFKAYVNRAINSKAQLNESEKLVQQAMQKLRDDPQADITQYGQELVSQNPKSYLAHQLLVTFQQMNRDSEGVIKTCESMLSLTDNPGPVYNIMGYAYMATNQMDKAKDAFEKYLRTEPDNANAYDSMGDYYAKSQDFDQAQQSYMRAYQMDSTNFMISHEKAEKIKEQVAEK